MSILNCMHTNPPKLGKIIALFDDGSGATFFFIDDAGFIYDTEGYGGYVIEDLMSKYSHWIDITNEEYDFWQPVED